MHTCIIIPSRLLTWQLFDITSAINSLVFLINRSVLETEMSGRAMGHLMNGYVDSSAGPLSGHALQDVEHSLTVLWFQHVSTPFHDHPKPPAKSTVVCWTFSKAHGTSVLRHLIGRELLVFHARQRKEQGQQQWNSSGQQSIARSLRDCWGKGQLLHLHSFSQSGDSAD